MGQKHRTGHLFKKGKTFYVRWTVAGKVFVRSLRDSQGNAITNKREAEEARARVMAPFAVADETASLEAIAGKLEGRRAELVKLEDAQNPPLPITQAWSVFITSPNRPDSGPETLYQYECQWTRFAEWMREKHPDVITLRAVTKDLAEEYASTLNHGKLSPNTYNKHLNVLALVFRVVKQKARLTENPWEDIPRKRLATQSRRELTIEELRKVCQSATGELRTLLALGVYSGLRLGDCATLRWGEVDLARGMIRRVPNKTARRNSKPVIVPIHPVLADMLREAPEETRGEYVLPETAADYLRRSDSVTDRVQSHFRACGVKVWKPGTGPDAIQGEETTPPKRAVIEVGFHSLRHSFVSLCRESNAPLAVVESSVGHSNPALTRHYTHVGELAAGQAIAALPTLIGDRRHEEQKPDLGAILLKIRAITESMTAETWSEQRSAILGLIPASP
jgi:integrase